MPVSYYTMHAHTHAALSQTHMYRM